MKELMRTNDVVVISVIESLFAEIGIHHMVLDANMSILEGSIGAIRRRIMVADDDYEKARNLVRDAGLGKELPD